MSRFHKNILISQNFSLLRHSQNGETDSVSFVKTRIDHNFKIYNFNSERVTPTKLVPLLTCMVVFCSGVTKSGRSFSIHEVMRGSQPN